MLHLKIDTRDNCVTVDGTSPPSKPRKFTRRWEAALLGALLEESQHSGALSCEALQARLLTLGQLKSLNRAQLQRLLDSLEAFLGTLPGQQARIESPMRKRTVGPWRLVHAGEWQFEVDGRNEALKWPHPGLLQANSVDALQSLLGTLMVADALAVEGRYASAVQTLAAFDKSTLSVEGQGLVSLRLCSWHRHLGDFQAARACAERVLGQPGSADPGISAHAWLLLQRINYDENPAQHWEALWQSTAETPSADAAKGSDWRTLSEWHNLRALLARRRMHQLDAKQLADAPAQPVAALHTLALRHFQAALYMALWSREWNSVQAYVANLAFHLQSCLDLRSQIGVTHDQVLAWHRLTMAYEDKLGAGRDTAWEYIFFAEFWLEHQGAFKPGAIPDPLSHHLGSSGPDQQEYYERALKRLRDCGDARQVAIGHSLYLRFAREHMRGDASVDAVHAQSARLAELLEAQPTAHVLKALVAEGYTKHWPADLQSRRMRKLKQVPSKPQ